MSYTIPVHQAVSSNVTDGSNKKPDDTEKSQLYSSNSQGSIYSIGMLNQEDE